MCDCAEEKKKKNLKKTEKNWKKTHKNTLTVPPRKKWISEQVWAPLQAC